MSFNAVVEPSRGIQLTDMQRAYLLGEKTGNYDNDRATHAYVEYVCRCCDPKTMIDAIKYQLMANDVFGMVVVWDDGSSRQEFVGNLEPNVPMVDISKMARAEKDAYVRDRRKALFEIEFDPEKLPRYAVEVTLVNEGVVVLHIAYDGMLMDGGSLLELKGRLSQSVTGGEANWDEGRFDEYVESCSENRASSGWVSPCSDDLEYWLHIASEFDSPLEFESPAESVTEESAAQFDEPTFHLEESISQVNWAAFADTACDLCVTPFSLCLALFGNAVSRYSGNDRFLVNVPSRTMAAFEHWSTLGLLSSFLLIPYSDHSRSIAEQARRISEELYRAKDHEALSGPTLLMEITKSTGSLMQVPVVFTSMVEDGDAESAVGLGFLRMHTSQTILEFTMYRALEGEVKIAASGRRGKIAPYMVRGILSMFVEGVNGLSRVLTVSGSQLPLIKSDAKMISGLSQGRGLATAPPLSKLLLDSLALNRGRDAVFDEMGSLTYEDLGASCKALLVSIEKIVEPGRTRTVDWPFDAGRVREHVRVEHTTVGLILTKSRYQAIAEISCIIGSLAFMPINIDLPCGLMTACLVNAGVTMVIAERETEDIACSLKGFEVVVIEDALSLISPAEWSERVLHDAEGYTPHLLSINTSGTTGKPKTVSINDWALGSCLMETRYLYGLDYPVRTIALTNTGHDMALFDTVAPLLYGGSVVFPSERESKEPSAWLRLIVEHGVNTWNSVPAFVQMYLELGEKELEKTKKTLRTFIFGGDFLGAGVCRRLKALYPQARIINCGGPSETTLWNVFHEVGAEDLSKAQIPYGKPFPGTTYRILDGFGRECPVGVAGEMHVCGLSLSNGYLSGDKLVTEGFTAAREEFSYPTGDIGFLNFDGELYILGRNDGRVKIHGKRIELSGIESILTCCKGIAAASVVLRKDPLRLIAFIVSKSPVDKNAIYAFLAGNLPAHMIPSTIVSIDRLPITPNGKVDSRALENFDLASISEERFVNLPPTQRSSTLPMASQQVSDPRREAIAASLVSIASSILERDVSLQDNFYCFGGDSLQAMRISAQISRIMDVDIKVYDLLARPTFEAWVDLALGEIKGKVSDVDCDRSALVEAVGRSVSRYLGAAEPFSNDEFFLLGGNDELAQAIANDLTNSLGISVDKYDLLFTPHISDWPSFLEW